MISKKGGHYCPRLPYIKKKTRTYILVLVHDPGASLRRWRNSRQYRRLLRNSCLRVIHIQTGLRLIIKHKNIIYAVQLQAMFIGQAQRRFPAEGGTLVNHTRRHTASPNSRTVQHFWLRIGIVRIINRIRATCHIWAIWSLTTVHKVQTHMALATDIPHVNTCANAISCKQIDDTYRPVAAGVL